MLEYPLISTIQTLEKEDKELLSLWLSSFFIILKKYKSFVGVLLIYSLIIKLCRIAI